MKPNLKSLSYLLGIFLLAGLFTGRGDLSAAPAPDNKSREPWRIEARKITSFNNSGVIWGQGDVSVIRGKLKVYADSIMYDRKHAKVRASGSVVIHLDSDVLRGSRGELDLKTATGTVDGAVLFLRRNNVYLTADRVWKTGPEEYMADNATVSTCSLPDQAWKIKCSDLKLTIDGSAVARHSTFNIWKIPVFYTPWMAVPLNKYRKTGFLLPEYISSKRNGIGAIVPFFVVLTDSMDATFYQQIMSSRGYMQGIEFRGKAGEDDFAVLRYNVLNDIKEDNDYNNDGFTRGNELRWWIRGKADQELPWGFKAKLDVDLVSDRDYLDEFNLGSTGYSETNSMLFNRFGRSLADMTDPVRPSTLQITRLDEDSFYGAAGVFNDNHTPGERDLTVQTLPSINWHIFKNRIGGTPFFYSLDTSYVNYWREQGIKSHRMDLEPSVQMPLDVGGWIDTVFSATLEESFYNTYGSDPLVDPASFANRLTYRLEADVSKTFSRKFRWDGKEVLRHSLIPRIIYTYRPDVDQDKFPDIDAHDRLPARNRFALSLLSFFTGKVEREPGRYTFADLARFEVRQDINIEEDYTSDLSRAAARSLGVDLEKHTLADLYGEIEITPLPWMYIRYDTSYNYHGYGFVAHNVWSRFFSKAGDHLYLDYRYNDYTNINELNIDLAAVIASNFTCLYHLKHNFASDSELESSYGIRYRSECWAVEGRLSTNRDDTSISFNVELLGIGGWGSGVK
jgi:LPS-assembly protein